MSMIKCSIQKEFFKGRDFSWERDIFFITNEDSSHLLRITTGYVSLSRYKDNGYIGGQSSKIYMHKNNEDAINGYPPNLLIDFDYILRSFPEFGVLLLKNIYIVSCERYSISICDDDFTKIVKPYLRVIKREDSIERSY